MVEEGAKKDNFNKLYSNLKSTSTTPEIEIKWTGGTSKIEVNKPGTPLQAFNSEYAPELEADEIFNGLQFHFHAKSEHTIDGEYMDLEMHTVHAPGGANKGGYAGAAMGIMFSVNDATVELDADEQKVIDDFFKSLEWDKTGSVKVSEVPYGDLMMMVDTRNRWVYKGSLTTPPCTTYVYWNVLTTVYPIKQEVLDNFNKQLGQKDGLKDTGNWRVI